MNASASAIAFCFDFRDCSGGNETCGTPAPAQLKRSMRRSSQSQRATCITEDPSKPRISRPKSRPIKTGPIRLLRQRPSPNAPANRSFWFSLCRIVWNLDKQTMSCIPQRAHTSSSSLDLKVPALPNVGQKIQRSENVLDRNHSASIDRKCCTRKPEKKPGSLSFLISW